MANDSRENEPKEPAGLGEHARGPASEAAHEQGWDINEEERTKQRERRPAHYGGKGYDYGAQDFGDTAGKLDNPEGATDETKDRPEDRKAS